MVASKRKPPRNGPQRLSDLPKGSRLGAAVDHGGTVSIQLIVKLAANIQVAVDALQTWASTGTGSRAEALRDAMDEVEQAQYDLEQDRCEGTRQRLAEALNAFAEVDVSSALRGSYVTDNIAQNAARLLHMTGNFRPDMQPQLLMNDDGVVRMGAVRLDDDASVDDLLNWEEPCYERLSGVTAQRKKLD